jgi:hypothetical protein
VDVPFSNTVLKVPPGCRDFVSVCRLSLALDPNKIAAIDTNNWLALRKFTPDLKSLLVAQDMLRYMLHHMIFSHGDEHRQRPNSELADDV